MALGFSKACDYGCSGYSPVCAKDERSGGPQNFDNHCKMLEENCRGGRKDANLFMFINYFYYGVAFC